MMQPQRPSRRTGLLEDQFWNHLEQHKLHLQRCADCVHLWYPPGPVCPHCLSQRWQWEPMSGRGRVASWTVFHRQYFTQMPPPYVVVVAELEEGPLIVADLESTETQSLQIGAPVNLRFLEVYTDDTAWWNYQWKLASKTSTSEASSVLEIL